MTSSFTSEYLMKSEYLTQFPRQNSAEFAIRGPYAESSRGPVNHLRPSPRNSAYHFYEGFPCLTAECVIVSMVGTTGAF